MEMTVQGPTIPSSHTSFVIGDIHGQYLPLVRLLQGAGLLEELRWHGKEARLWFVGDLFDRGPDGLAVLNLVMRLQREARAVGGDVNAILGNHEVMLLGAYRLGDLGKGANAGFFESWKRAGGRLDDLADLRPDHLRFLESMPAMMLDQGNLLMHADTVGYERYGRTVDEVNSSIKTILVSRDPSAWASLIGTLNERDAFLSSTGGFRAERMLERFGGNRIVHGHTPISLVVNQAAESVLTAYEYQDGLCVNVDAGLYLGAKGFVHALSPAPRRKSERRTAPETA
jgi:Calcineurin-like phosphoesterase